MKVICKQNKINSDYELLVLFTKDGQKDIYDEDYFAVEDGYYHSDEGLYYDIKIGQEYEVYGIMIFEGKTRYLVKSDVENLPIWVTDDMFEIIDNRLPYNWKCNNFTSNNIEGTIIGYSELTNNYNHLLGLMKNKPEDIKKFLDQKDKIEYFI